MTDSSAMETQARAVLQGVQDEAKKIRDQLAAHGDEADRILGNIKSLAAEQGVSQQAEFFKKQADDHRDEAESWRKRTVRASLGLGLVVFASLFFHKIPWFAPKNAFEIAQLTTSKIVLFAVLGYWVVLCARNFLSHQHNAVVNRHRQTALQTYRALSDAAGETGTEDIVLAHASACIFGPQDTGFTRAGADGGSAAPKAVLELLTKSKPE